MRPSCCSPLGESASSGRADAEVPVITGCPRLDGSGIASEALKKQVCRTLIVLGPLVSLPPEKVSRNADPSDNSRRTREEPGAISASWERVFASLHFVASPPGPRQPDGAPFASQSWMGLAKDKRRKSTRLGFACSDGSSATLYNPRIIT